MISEDRLRRIAPAGYLLGAMLLLVPLMELGMGTWPPRPSMVNWRFGVIGLFANALMVPLLGAGLLVAVAAGLGHRRVLRTLSVVALVACAAIVALLLLFALDIVQMRSMVQAQVKLGFDLASLKSVIVLVLGAVFLATLGLAGWRASRPPRRGQGRSASRGTEKLVIGRASIESADARGSREPPDLPAHDVREAL